MKRPTFFRSALALLLCLTMVLSFVPMQTMAAETNDTKVETVADCAHEYGSWSQSQAPGCETQGWNIRTCSLCGGTESEAVEALGHDFTAVQFDANCLHCAHTAYTCDRCGYSYNTYDESLYTPWQETQPQVDASLIESKRQYRYSDYETKISYETSLEGYEQVSNQWVETGSGSASYVSSWPAGFDTTSSLYAQYNEKLTDTETRTQKIVITSDAVAGYLYYHWCYADSFYSEAQQSESYNVFHAYYSTVSPDQYICDFTDMSYQTMDTCCSNSEWFFVTEVNEQQYTEYSKEFTYGRWTDFTDWSDTQVSSSDTRKVQIRTVYRYVDTTVGEHSYASITTEPTCVTPGSTVYTCSVCNDSYTQETPATGHDYQDGICSVCGDQEPAYYLFGYINGADYGCEGDYENMGQYKFVDGQLVATFEQDSYVAVKTEGNLRWYMAKEYVSGDSATLYNTNTGSGEKMFVPGGMEITFTLSYGGNDTLTLSYTSDQCIHSYVETVITPATCTEDGQGSYTCSKCSDSYEAVIAATGHSYVRGVCQGCGDVDESYVAPVYYLFGYFNGEDYGSEGDFENRGEFRFEEGKLLVTFSQDSYVGVKTEDNSAWYMTREYVEDTTAVLYNTNTGASEKMFVPARMEVLFTLEEGDNDTLILSYTATPCKHIYQETVITEAGCETTGMKQLKCAVCAYTVEEEIPAAGHDYVSEVVAPGCITSGYTAHTCSRCGDSYQDTATDATGHDYASEVTEEPGCETTGVMTYTCGLCGNSYTGQISAKGHSYEAVVTAPGCEAAGFTTYTCSGCGDSYTTDSTPAIGHSYKGVTGKVPTCVDDGIMVYTCEHCGDSYTEVLEAFGHNYISEATPPTCEADGFTTHTCSICGSSYADTLVSALGHDYQDGVCVNCGQEDPALAPPAYCLFGYINGANYACEEDYENMGVYKFKDGQLVATFKQDSYIGIKLEGNLAWYMTEAYVTETTGTFYNTDTGVGEKMLIPGGLQITFTLTVNDDDTLTLSYETAPCEHSFSSQVTLDPGCETEGVLTLTCDLCGISQTQTIDPIGHSYKSEVTAPTCTSKGYTTHTCENCGDSYQDTETAVTGHKTESEITLEPGCETTGEMRYTCTVCGYSYTGKIEATGHDYQSVVTAPGCETEGYTTYTCHCGDTYKDYFVAAVGHSYESATTVTPGCETEGLMTYTCADCGDSYTQVLEAVGHNFISEAVAPTCTENGYTIHTCSLCGYSHSDTVVSAIGHDYSTVTTSQPTCDEPGVLTSTCANCGDVYTEDIKALGHKYETVTVEPTCTEAGSATGTCSVCGDVNVEELPATGHSFEKGICTVCGAEDPDYAAVDYYLFGYINGANYACEEDYENLGEYKFEKGSLVATFTETSYVAVKTGDNGIWYMTDGWQGEVSSAVLYDSTTLTDSNKLFVPGGVEITFTLTENDDGTLTLSYSAAGCIHSYEAQVTAEATCTEDGSQTLTCSQCGDSYTETIPATGHSFVMGVCKICGAADESYVAPDYYLFGFINGANYGCEEDYENLGEYKFENGTLTAVFTEDSYVAVKTGDNGIWYMTDGWQGSETTFVTLYDSTTLAEPNKLFVPGGVEIVFTMLENEEGTLTLSYETKEITPSTVPTLKLSFPTLTFEDMISMNVYFTATDISDVVEMGMITYSSQVTDYSINTAEKVIPGYTWSDTYQMYAITTGAIAAKDMSDTIYFAAYAKLADGTYAYSSLVSYSPTSYAATLLSSGDQATKNLMVAMLNYGAEAQTFFNYRTDALMNASLTAEQKASIESYRADMMASVSAVDATKAANFTRTDSGFTSRYPSISFEGAFQINYYCVPSAAPAGEITLYYWNQADFDATDVLTTDNATGAIAMTEGTDRYEAAVTGIAAKDLDKGIYVAFVYSDGEANYCSGILGYSIGAYCVANAATTDAIAPFARATAVYGYYAKQFFNV